MADFTRLLAGETAEDVAEVFDAGLTEQAEECADHVRCGKFEDLIKKAHKVTDHKSVSAEQIRARKNGTGMFCVTGEKTTDVSLEANLDRLSRVNAKLREKEQTEAVRAIASKDDILLKNSRIACSSLCQNNSAYAANLQNQPQPMELDSELSELERLREARLTQLRREKVMSDKWKSMGHGSIQLLTDQRDFLNQIKNRERSIVVIHARGDPNCDIENSNSFMSVLSKLAEKHIETGIFQMHEDKAVVMLSMLEIPDGGTPLMFILRHGEVICRISRSFLLDPAITSEGTKGEQKLERLLKSRDALGEGKLEGGTESSSDDSDDNDCVPKHRQKKLDYVRF